jgi:dipeptidyl aminopeptidase/acylaminoacyl peptidase
MPPGGTDPSALNLEYSGAPMRSAPLLKALSAPRVYCAAVLLVAFSLACSEAGRGVAGPASGGFVFVREKSGNADLMRARLSDGSVARITRTPGREERWPYWSSLAGRVVFQVRPYGASLMTDLRLWDPATGEETMVTQTARRDERWPAWSPSASELAYVFKDARGPTGIALYDLEMETTQVLARAGRRDAFVRPAYAPDGARLVAERRTPARNGHLWLLEPGRPPRPLTGRSNNDGKASFAPDGTSLVFTRRHSRMGPGDLARLDLATGEVMILASLPGADDHSGKLSPVRDELAFVSDRDGSRDIFLVELPDGVPLNLTHTPELHEGAPRWSPDGEWLLILRFPERDAAAEGSPDEIRPDPASARIAVIDRSGQLLFETAGTMADWMPAWP